MSVVVITRNEAARIDRCLASVAWADEIVVVDAGSADGTAERCRAFTPRVLVREFDTFDRQKNFALAQATGRWVLSVDADEVVTPALRDEVRAIVARDGDGHAGFLVHRESSLCGHPIRHVWGRDALVRLVKHGRGRFANAVHEKLDVDGSIGELRERLLHYNSDTFAEYLAKNHHYLRLDAAARRARGERFRLVRAVLAPVRVFAFRYLTLGGFRDGAIGFILSALLAFFTFLMHVRLWELEASHVGRQRAS